MSECLWVPAIQTQGLAPHQKYTRRKPNVHISRKYNAENTPEKKTEETSKKYASKIHLRKYTREIHRQEKLNMFTSRKYQASGISYQTLVEGSEIFPRSKESCDEEKMFYILSDI